MSLLVRFPLCAPLLFATACFAPNIDNNVTEGGTGTGAGTDGPTSTVTGPTAGTQGTTSTTDGPTSVGPTTGPTSGPTTTAEESSSGVAGDDPPTFDSFTVEGSTMPDEIDSAATVTVEANVEDDVGVVRVEFMVDGEVFETVEEPPYTAKRVLSSADSGIREFSARAYDTVEQDAVSDAIDLSVNIAGGALIEIRRDIFVGNTLLTLRGNRIVTDPDGQVYVFGSLPSSGGSRILKYNPSLSLLWTRNASDMIGSSAAFLEDEDAFAFGWTLRVDSDEIWRFAHVAVTNGGTISNNAQNILDPADATSFITGPAIAAGPRGDIYMSAEPTTVERRAADFSGSAWTANFGTPGDGGVGDLTAFEGDVFVSFGHPDCATEADSCLRRLRADGSTAWTRGFSFAGLPKTAVAPDGTAFTVLTDLVDSELFVTAPDGTPGYSTPLGDSVIVHDVTAEAQGTAVIVGSSGPSDNRDAWAMRVDRDGTVLWESTLVQAPDAEFHGCGVSPTNRLYVTGIENITTNPGVLNGERGDSFVAEFGL